MNRRMLLSAVCLAGLTAAGFLAAAGLKGDYNGDGQQGLIDVLTLLVQGAADPDDGSLDYNGDGRYSAADPVALVRHLRDIGSSCGPSEGHDPLPQGALPVDSAGVYADSGSLYMLTRDISSPVSAVFLGQDVTLDLNGYTLTYADGGYGHVVNSGFEDGLTGWDVSRAPGAQVRDTRTTQTFVGDKLLYLPYQQEIISSYVCLPVAGRTYYAMCGVAKKEMVVSIYVEDSTGSSVECQFEFEGTVRQTCPELDRSPELGGGILFAQLRGLPAGRYRVRVKAQSEGVLIDEVDIRPALDVGVGIVDATYPWSYYRCVPTMERAAFTDYTQPGSRNSPLAWIPRVSGPGTITIRNGVIRSGTLGVRSWGVQSTASQATVVLENVRFEAAGINTFAVDAPRALIRNCRFEMDSPFIINRHNQGDQPVNLSGPGASEVSGSEFIGGQGNLTVGGDGSSVHDNLFVNRQMVTNHYSLGVGGDGVKVFNNRFEPEVGSGILVGSVSDAEIYNNVFHVRTSPPTCEYGFGLYSVNAIRLTDYDAAPGQGSDNIRVHDNRFFVQAVDYPERDTYQPMVNAIFHSVGGGTCYIYDNEATVEHADPASKAYATAFYIGGSSNGGQWYGNTITSNVPGFWLANPYGPASNAVVSGNTFRLGPGPYSQFAPVLLGFYTYAAQNIDFRSNYCEGFDFKIRTTTQVEHSWKVYWTLRVELADSAGKTLAGQEVVITDRSGAEAARQTSGANGALSVELPEYYSQAGTRTVFSPYRVTAGAVSDTANLDSNRTVRLSLP